MKPVITAGTKIVRAISVNMAERSKSDKRSTRLLNEVRRKDDAR